MVLTLVFLKWRALSLRASPTKAIQSTQQSWHMVGCQNDGALLGLLNTRCRIILRAQKGTIIWTATHVDIG